MAQAAPYFSLQQRHTSCMRSSERKARSDCRCPVWSLSLPLPRCIRRGLPLRVRCNVICSLACSGVASLPSAVAQTFGRGCFLHRSVRRLFAGNLGRRASAQAAAEHEQPHSHTQISISIQLAQAKWLPPPSHSSPVSEQAAAALLQQRLRFAAAAREAILGGNATAAMGSERA